MKGQSSMDIQEARKEINVETQETTDEVKIMDGSESAKNQEQAAN